MAGLARQVSWPIPSLGNMSSWLLPPNNPISTMLACPLEHVVSEQNEQSSVIQQRSGTARLHSWHISGKSEPFERQIIELVDSSRKGWNAEKTMQTTYLKEIKATRVRVSSEFEVPLPWQRDFQREGETDRSPPWQYGRVYRTQI